MVLACDCSSGAHIAQAISSGGENAEAKGPATNVRQFARFAQQRGMVEGVHWAIDPRPGVQRLMQLAFPHHGSPNTPKAPAALEELERMAGLGPPERPAEEQYGVQERGAEPPLEPPPEHRWSGSTLRIGLEQPPGVDGWGFCLRLRKVGDTPLGLGYCL